ncbi:MAG: hypothetical protein KDA32_07845 [Phycisphaerales bacterium]|nr:hypothetical protein [Phycisphaerales bacterium]
MNSPQNRRSGRRMSTRKVGALGAILTAAATPFLMGGCNDEESLRAFRDAASTSLESSVNSFFDGVVSGAFAVFDLGAQGAANADTNTSTTDTSSTDTSTSGG